MSGHIESWNYGKSSNTILTSICCVLHKINMKSLKHVAFAHQSKLAIREDPIIVTWFLDTCCCIDAMSRHWTCHAISGLLQFAFHGHHSWLTDINCRYPVPDLLHDVQRPINDQRSLRHRACSERRQQKTGASWRQARVRGLRQKVYTEKEPQTSSKYFSWRGWRWKLSVWRLLLRDEAQGWSQKALVTCPQDIRTVHEQFCNTFHSSHVAIVLEIWYTFSVTCNSEACYMYNIAVKTSLKVTSYD